MPIESKSTQKAREYIIEMLQDNGYQIAEEEVFPTENNIGDISLDYQADIVARKTFIIELDPEFHGSKIHRNKDEWRDKNIYKKYQIKTVRLDPKDIIKDAKTDPINTWLEIDTQLNDKERFE